MITTEQIYQWVEGSNVLYKKLFQSYVEKEYLKNQCLELCEILAFLISASNQKKLLKEKIY